MSAHRKSGVFPPFIIFIAPSFVFFILFYIYPIVTSFIASFTDWTGIKPLFESNFIGLDNYIALVKNPEFIQALINIFIYCMGIPFAVFLGFALALLLSKIKRQIRTPFLVAYFTPMMTSLVALSIVWSYLYNPLYGVFNDILLRMGLKPLGWLTDPRYALVSIMIMNIWRWSGYHMIILLAGIEEIPQPYLEAALVDGAGFISRVTNVILPLLKPVLLFQFVTSTIGSLQMFTESFIMTSGGPAGATMTPVMLIYYQSFRFLKFGYGSAISVIMFIITLGISLIQIRLVKSGYWGF